MKRSRYTIMAVVLLAASGLAAIAFAGNTLLRKAAPAAQPETKAPAADPRLLQELATVYAQLNNSDWAMEGEVTVTDKADPANSMQPLAFSYHQQGKRLYYRLGKTEMVNLEDCYIVLEHEAERIFVSGSREVTQAPYLPLATLQQMTEQEAYAVTRKTEGAVATIALSRENHISCKEYALSYDTASLQLRGIRTRLTNLDAPTDTAKDKVMDVRITDRPAPGSNNCLKRSRYVREQQGQLVPAAAFSHYQLIRN